MDNVHQCSDDLLKIINDILDISKIEARQIILYKTDVSLDVFVDNVKNNTTEKRNRLGKNNIQINVYKGFSGNESIIEIDENRLIQILTNLLDNALKFTEEGFINFGYQLSENRMVQFFVEDTGIGIPYEKQTIIFEKFRQAEEGYNRSYGGNGLGLPISKGLIELLEGEIWVASNQNKGSTFYFTIPYKSNIVKETIKPVVTENYNFTWPGKSILIVEDDIISAEYLKEILSDAGVKYFHAQNGTDALKLFQQNDNIGLVLMDIQLPDINGYEVTKQIKELKNSIPVIAQTAHAMSEDQQKSRAAGCDDYISKPINNDELLKIIARYL